MTTFEWVCVSVAAGFGFGVLGFTLVTYAVARSHHEPRPLRSALGNVAREVLLTVVMQPLLPLYFLLGRRMGGAGGVPIILVHGYLQNRVDFLYLARVLRRRGLGPLYGFNYWSLGRIEKSAERLGRFADRACEETGAARVDLVCHSLGGLVGVELARARPERVRRLATLASPHAGIAWPGPVPGDVGRQMKRGARFLAERASVPAPVPILSVYSTHDNVVYPARTSSRAGVGGTDLVVAGVGHYGILFDRVAANAVADFLSELGGA